MVDEQDRRAAIDDVAQVASEHDRFMCVEAGRGFVEAQQLGTCSKGSRDGDELALALCEIGRSGLGDAAEFEQFERLVDGARARHGSGEQFPQRRQHRGVVGGNGEVLAYRQVVEQLDRLPRAGETETGAGVRRQLADVGAGELDLVPLVKADKDRNLQYRVEQCPMPGWTPGDNFHNNIAYAPGMWIALHQIAERNGVGDQFRIHYDPSHAILMGQDTRSIFQYLKDAGYGFLIVGMHVKGQVIHSEGVAGWGYGGQTVQRGDWVDGEVSSDPADLANAWKKQMVLCEHELPGTARHDPLAYLQNRTMDWLDHQLAARELLDFDPTTTPLIVEHEYGAARVQDKELLQPILAASMAFTRHIDRAAASMYALQAEVLASQGIPVQGVGREAYRS